MTTATYTITPAQQSFVNSLIDERDTDACDTVLVPVLDRTADECRDGKLSKRDASRAIDLLKAIPRKPTTDLPDIPEGRYALGPNGDAEFYRVDRPDNGKWAGWTFVKQQTGDNYRRVRGSDAKAVLAAIAEAGPKAAAVRYGRETGTCAICGRGLTDPESVDAGIGPVCATRF